MKRVLLSSLCGLVMFSSSLLFAKEAWQADTYQAPGQIYGGYSLLYSDSDCRGTLKNCEGNGWKLQVGYKFNELLGVEAGYYRLADNDGRDPDGSLINTTNSGLALAGTATHAVNDKSAIFGKAGVMVWESNVEAFKTVDSNVSDVEGVLSADGSIMNGTDALLGIGMTHQLTDNITIRGEYERVEGNLGADIYSIGASLSTL